MATIVLGTQWGDEGKGKLIDVLLHTTQPPFRLCARAAGGDNAGHTIEHGGVKYDFHILPSGLLSASTENLIGTGCVVHVPGFFKELDQLKAKGLNTDGRVKISSRAHVVFRLHQLLDGLEEKALGKGNIGTTKRGIGPTYSSKAARTGIRVGEIFRKDEIDSRLRMLAANAKQLHGDLGGYNVDDEIREFDAHRERLRPFVIDHVPLLRELQAKQEPILVEGANACLLDIDFGTYPFVTSSNTGIAGAFVGLGLSPHKKWEIIGVVKAYTTRVGSGPFPTEDEGEVGQKLQKEGREFGATTGRPRRCGPLDLPILRYSRDINHYTVLNLTKLDVLDDFETIQVATEYRLDGNALPSFPDNAIDVSKIEVVYRELPGWKTSIQGCKTWKSLPPNARNYVEFVERELEVPIKWIGTGPERENGVFRALTDERISMPWIEAFRRRNQGSGDEKHKIESLKKRDLSPKTMRDSFHAVVLPLAQDEFLSDTYLNSTGHIRLGTVLMDLDALSGIIAYKHTGEGVTTVTAAVDRITIQNPLRELCDLEYSGHVTYASGRSSMEITCSVAKSPAEGQRPKPEDVFVTIQFTMVSLDPQTKKQVYMNTA
ncbi:MAG: hypothetical protein Q9159_002199 [Coniocarpon cinnabarinum]